MDVGRELAQMGRPSVRPSVHPSTCSMRHRFSLIDPLSPYSIALFASIVTDAPCGVTACATLTHPVDCGRRTAAVLGIPISSRCRCTESTTCLPYITYTFTYSLFISQDNILALNLLQDSVVLRSTCGDSGSHSQNYSDQGRRTRSSTMHL